jgi:hypothetical protein
MPLVAFAALCRRSEHQTNTARRKFSGGNSEPRLLCRAHNEKNMSMISVSSSAIRAVGYEDGTLAVAFHTTGTYYHHGVSYSLFERFLISSSKGAFYNAYIRGRYR